MKRLFLVSLATLLAVLGALGPKAAHAAHTDPRIAISVRDLDRGQMLPLHAVGGQRYLAGDIGHRYAIHLRNLTGQRLLLVLSVDGINAVTGESASPEQSGYVLEPYQTTEVRGWRKSLHEVAEFSFAALPASYAARTGRPHNVGVIGAAVFEERPVPLWRQPPAIGRDEAKSAAPAAESERSAAPRADQGPGRRSEGLSQRSESLGTAHGQRRYDPARHTTFQRASRRPAEVQQLFYDSRENLIAAGILPAPWPHSRRQPDPFPIGFVPDP